MTPLPFDVMPAADLAAPLLGVLFLWAAVELGVAMLRRGVTDDSGPRDD